MQTQQDILYNKITERFENRLIYNIYESKLEAVIHFFKQMYKTTRRQPSYLLLYPALRDLPAKCKQ